MRVLFILEYYYPNVGGAEKLFKQVAEELAVRRVEVAVITTRFRSDLPKTETYNGVRIHRVSCFNRFFFTLFAIPAALHHAADFDLILTTSYTAALPAWVAATLHRKKKVIVFHEVWDRLWFRLPYLSKIQGLGFYLFEKLVLQLSFDRFVAVSQFTGRSLAAAGISRHRISVIYNGLEYEKLKPYPHQPPPVFTAMYLGRLGVSKGLDIIIPAMKIFIEKHPEVQFKIVLPLRPKSFLRRILNQIKMEGLTDKNATILHELSRDQLYREMASSTCILVPSYSEGFGFVAAEAVGLGIPLISSGKGALPEVVSGQFIEMELHTAQGLAAALEKAYHGRWHHAPEKVFPLRRTVDKYIALIRKMTQNPIGAKPL